MKSKKPKKPKKCKTDCGCPSKIKEKHQNGKGDKPRSVNPKKYNKNYGQIDWNTDKKY